MTDRKRVIEALRSAAENASEKAAAIRAELAEIEEDGAPDGPPRRTSDYCYEDDAREWDIDAEILDGLRERVAGGLCTPTFRMPSGRHRQRTGAAHEG